ncbi:molybdenum-pterin binding domain-containing protein [Solimonas aquatica]|uniref:Molybdenum-pterin binding domain-containing protein n=1 Tax=Solimonas aquatica TaxID=489703 RepID=A0A1H9LKE0_9GAMM|nr:TOBE domain-containing protein [Solimonas aquatica]SER11896.1 molybdenum-pterin binding domain-containing protein [Solimonas aquatica]
MSVTSINTRNQFKGQIVAIKRGEIVSEVEIETSAGIISAVVTTSSLQRLNLRVGNAALALFKATEVMIAKLADD